MDREERIKYVSIITTILIIFLVIFLYFAYPNDKKHNQTENENENEKKITSNKVERKPKFIIKNNKLKVDKYSDKYDLYFKKYTKRYFGIGVDYRWFKSQSVAESALKPNAESWVGAKGLMQIMPNTFSEIQQQKPQYTDIYNPSMNIGAGIYYNHKLFNNWTAPRPFKDRMSFTFASYNAGLGNILKGQKVCNNYVEKNCNLWKNVKRNAHKVDTWKYNETLHYVKKIHNLMEEK